MGTEFNTELTDALKDRAYHLAKNVEDLTPGQIAEVEANPRAYLPEGYFTKVETPVEAPEPPAKPVVGKRAPRKRY